MTRVATPETEATLLEFAQSTSAARLEQLARRWKTLSRDGELSAEEARNRSRTFSVAIDADGMYVVRGRLEPEVGAAPMRRDWWPSGRWRRGSGVGVVGPPGEGTRPATGRAAKCAGLAVPRR